MNTSRTERGVATSVIIGAAALLWSLTCDVLTGFRLEARAQLHHLLTVVWMPGLQVLAVLNAFFAIRDAGRGQALQATLGFVLSLLGALEPLVVVILSR